MKECLKAIPIDLGHIKFPWCMGSKPLLRSKASEDR